MSISFYLRQTSSMLCLTAVILFSIQFVSYIAIGNILNCFLYQIQMNNVEYINIYPNYQIDQIPRMTVIYACILKE